MTQETEIGQKIKKLRSAKGWTQEELARQAGLSLWTIASIEQGRVKQATLGTLKKLAAALGVPLTRFLNA